MICTKSLFPIVGMIFHPSYMLVNSKLLGSVEIDAEKCAGVPKTTYGCIPAETYLASFDIASSTMGILFLATGTCFVLALTNITRQAYGSGNFKMCGAYLDRMILCYLSIFLHFCLLSNSLFPTCSKLWNKMKQFCLFCFYLCFLRHES